MRFPQRARLLAACLMSMLWAAGSPHAAAIPQTAPSPKPSSTPEDRAREVEREDLEEDAPSTPGLDEAPAPTSPAFIGPPVPSPEPLASPEPAPPPTAEPLPSPSPSPEPAARGTDKP